MTKARPRNSSAATMRMKGPLVVVSVDAAGGAASVAMTTGATIAGMASVGTRVGAGGCATTSCADRDCAGGGGTAAGPVAASITEGTDVANGAGNCESVPTGEEPAATVETTDFEESPAAVGRGVIVAP